jgi:hypothetical protein
LFCDGNYQISFEEIGKLGEYGEVFKVKRIYDNKFYAVKKTKLMKKIKKRLHMN